MSFGPPWLEIAQFGSPGREFSATDGFGDGRLTEGFLEADVAASVVHPATGIAAAAAASPRKRRREGLPPEPPAGAPGRAGSCVME
jgi:hypothetical protein